MKRRRFLSGLATLPLLPWLGACSAAPLRLGIHPWIGYETLYLARDFGWLPPAIQLQSGASASDSLAGLQQDRLDAACLTLDEVLLARGAGVSLTIGLVFNVSAGADMVLAREGIQRLEQLAGKRLGVEPNALGALMLAKVLRRAGLSPSALTLVELAPESQLEAWRTGRLDAVITYEPTAGQLLQLGARRLFDSRELPDTIFDVLAVRRDRIRRPQLQALTAAHFRALEHIRSNRQDALYRIAARQGVSHALAERALAGVVLPMLSANRRYLVDGEGKLAQAAALLAELMAGQGLLARPDDRQGLFSPLWLPSEREHG
ncbi:ABC transporter substrate-binding protein [Zobellella denitrificans]